MNRILAGLGVTGFSLSVIVGSVAALSVEDTEPPSGSVTQSAEAEPSPVGLAGTAAAFLALGTGTLVISHRRRWGAVDLQDSETPHDVVDLRDSRRSARRPIR